MRRVFFASTFLFGLIALAGCTINHDFSFDIDKTFTVSSGVTSYHDSEIVDPSSNSDFNKYKADISAVNIESATLTITRDGQSAGQTVSAVLSAGDANGNGTAQLATATNVDIFNSVNVDQPLTVDNTVANQLGNWLKNSPNKATLTLDATTNRAPVDFDVRIRLHVSATYSAGLLSFL